MSEAYQKTLAQEIADILGEKQPLARKQIETIVGRFGDDGALQLLQETLAIEANGGMLTNNGTRRRTVGGVFFHLALQQTEPLQRTQIRQNYVRKVMLQSGEMKPSVPRRFRWQQNKLEELFERHGEVFAVKIILTGRPGRVQHYKDMIVTTMKGTGIPNQFPRGVPTPPSTPTDYIVYISAKQWKKVSDAIKNPDDALIVEGYCAFDADAKAIGVYTTAITTRMTRIALKEQQKATLEGETNGKVNDTVEGDMIPAPAVKPAAPRTNVPPPPAPKKPAPVPVKTVAAPVKQVVNSAPAPVAPSISRDEASAKLKSLYKAEDDAREAMEEIKSLPPNEQAGLGEALRELQRVKNEIKAIKQQFPGL
ncbi:MAG: phosphorylated adapter RNA export RNA-binding domain-containing protein [Anaerolineae bacterium]